MIRLLAVLLAFAGPAFATTDGWPALYDVTGVASDDVLNIRTEPDAASEIIGTLAHDAVNVEVIRPNEDYTWGLVNLREFSGWVSLNYLARHPGQWDGKYPEVTTCYGTEPFWNIRLTGDVVAFSGLDLDSLTAPLDWKRETQNHRGRHSFRAGPMVGIFSNANCNDGMSNAEFGIEINLIRLDQPYHYQGCCSIQPPEASR